MAAKSSHSSLAAALAAFQADLPKVHKGSTNTHFKSKYAALEDIVSVVLPKLAAQGLAWITRPTADDGALVLEYELRHESGESITGTYPLGSGNHQQLGSAITYARRYTLSAVTGIAPDEDDDGNAAAEVKQPTRRPQKAPEPARRDWNGEVQTLIDARDLDGLKALRAEAEKAGAPATFLEAVDKHIEAAA